MEWLLDKTFCKTELFSHFHHSCRHPLCSCLFSSELKLRPTFNLKEWPTLFTKSSLPLCSENTGIGNFIQSWKVVKHGKNTKYWVVVSSLECISPLLFLHCNVWKEWHNNALIRHSFSFYDQKTSDAGLFLEHGTWHDWAFNAVAWGPVSQRESRFPQNPGC